MSTYSVTFVAVYNLSSASSAGQAWPILNVKWWCISLNNVILIFFAVVLCSHGEGGGIRGSWRVARSRHRAVSGPRVQATWTRCQTHGNVGRNLWEVWSTYILSEKVNAHVLWWIQTFHNIVSSRRKGGFFVDLFVRVSNQVAVNMYKRLGYSVYRTVIEYYSASNGEPDEDAYGESARVVILLFWVAAETWITCAAHD